VFYSFVRDVAWPLGLKLDFTLTTLTNLQRGAKVRSSETFRALLRMLSEDQLRGAVQVFAADPSPDKRTATATFEKAAYRFMQYFVFDVCFSAGGAPTLQMQLLEDLVGVLAGNPPDGQMLAFEVLPSEASRVALLRHLLRLPSGGIQEAVTLKLQEQMQLAVRQFQHADTDLSVSFCNLKEEELMESCPDLADYGIPASRLPELKLNDI
jgi:hypothetical protein